VGMVRNPEYRLSPGPNGGYGLSLRAPRTRERSAFYTKVEGALTYEGWLAGVRRGRTFVSNGPMLEFRVAGKDMGRRSPTGKAGYGYRRRGASALIRRETAFTHWNWLRKGEVIRSFPTVEQFG